MTGLRIISSCILFLASVFTPWPFSAGLAIILIAVFPWFLEAIFSGLILGSIYGFSKEMPFFFLFLIFSFAIILFIAEYLKSLIPARNIFSNILIILIGGFLMGLFWLSFKAILYV